MTRQKPQSELTGWKRTFHLKLRFGLSKLPFFPVRYRLRTPGFPDAFFYWTHVIPFMDPILGAFDFECYGWDVRELVGASPGLVDLYIPVRGIDTIGSLRSPAIADGSTRKLTVKMVTLDGFTAAHPIASLDLIKLDVEGAETAVLEGSVQLIERHQPFWLFEALDATSAAWGTSGRALVELHRAGAHHL